MAAIIGCGVVAAGLLYYKRTSIIKTFLTKYSDYKECQHAQEQQIFNETPKEKLISCKHYEFIPEMMRYDRTTDRSFTPTKICKLKFKNMVFYSFLKNYNLRDTYLEYIDNLETENAPVSQGEPIITHLNKITNRTAQLLSATATIKIKSHNVDYIPEFDILDLLNKFSFNGNTLFMTDATKAHMIALINTEYSMNIDLDNFCMDGDNTNMNADNLDIEVHYQLITNNADIYNGINIILKFDEYNELTVVTKYKDL